MRAHLGERPGEIRALADDRVLGQHQGHWFHTIGQRQGLGLGNGPWYVVGKVLDENALVVVQGEDPLLYSEVLQASGPSWIGEPPPELAEGRELRCMAKIRYRQPDQACVVSAAEDGALEVAFDTPQRAVAPGQYAVFYDDDRCLGGAVIDSAMASSNRLRAAI